MLKLQAKAAASPPTSTTTTTPAMAAADLPHAAVKRLIASGGAPASAEAVRALAAAAQVFVHYLAFAADGACKGARRQTLSAGDVLAALDELELGGVARRVRERLDQQAHDQWGVL